MSQVMPFRRNIAPRINLHQASEPASPINITIATTLSPHSSPSPLPSRVMIVSEHHNNADCPHYDENFPLKEHPLTEQHVPPARFTLNPSPTFPISMCSEPNQSWPLLSPQLLDCPKLQRSQHQHHQQQQLFYQNQAPVFHTDGEAIPALSPSRGSASRPSISELEMPVTASHSPVPGEAGRPVAREHAFMVDWADACLPLRLEHHTGSKPMRTVSDAEQDELFNPGIAPGTAAHTQPERIATTKNLQLPTLLQQAQNQHLARADPAKPVVTVRGHSPFRANSPFHPARTQQEIIPSPTRTTALLGVGAYTTARSQREKDIERDAEALRQQLHREYEELQQTPNTISPKDSYIEYAEAEDSNDAQGACFSSSQSEDAFSQHSINNESDGGSYHGDDDTEQGYDSASQGNSDVSHHSDPNYEHNMSPHRKPADTMANGGAYSCTALGCSLRFSTASKMSKHRLEVHKNNTPLGRDAPIKSLLQGPSRCKRTNPTTGKPCNTKFSRTYDLTRHEDTIHNTARQKVRCEICNDGKTFSRFDALARHKKVCFITSPDTLRSSTDLRNRLSTALTNKSSRLVLSLLPSFLSLSVISFFFRGFAVRNSRKWCAHSRWCDVQLIAVGIGADRCFT